MEPTSATFRRLACLASIQGRTHDAADLRRLADGDDPASMPDLSDRVRDTLDALRASGGERVEADALLDIPRDLRWLIADTRGIGADEAEAIVREHGAVTAGDFAALVESGALRTHPSRQARVEQALVRLAESRERLPLGRAAPVAEALAGSIRDLCPEVAAVEPAGSLRRFAALVGDVALVVSTPDPARTGARLGGAPLGLRVAHAVPGRLVLLGEREEIDLHLVRPDRFGAALLLLTGSVGHVSQLRGRALSRGGSLSLEGLMLPDRGRAETEDAIYAALDLPWIAPELREASGEIEAADRESLPQLVAGADIRGDLHMHTDWSDGRDSIDAMIGAAEALGYEYVAITDHSVSSAVARGLDVSRLAAQQDAVAAARERHPGITVLHGAEVDILHDGTLDFPDAVLERLDVVLASLHDPGTDSGERLTDRYIAAMRHPLVHIVTHPTNRLVPYRPGYELDEHRLFDAAVETGTVLEIDGAPGHLDMDGAMARRAIDAGVRVSIDGDCHRAEWLGRQMQYGVSTARRGWVEARHAINTAPLAELRRTLARKRHGR